MQLLLTVILNVLQQELNSGLINRPYSLSGHTHFRARFFHSELAKNIRTTVANNLFKNARPDNETLVYAESNCNLDEKYLVFFDYFKIGLKMTSSFFLKEVQLHSILNLFFRGTLGPFKNNIWYHFF